MGQGEGDFTIPEDRQGHGSPAQAGTHSRDAQRRMCSHSRRAAHRHTRHRDPLSGICTDAASSPPSLESGAETKTGLWSMGKLRTGPRHAPATCLSREPPAPLTQLTPRIELRAAEADSLGACCLVTGVHSPCLQPRASSTGTWVASRPGVSPSLRVLQPAGFCLFWGSENLRRSSPSVLPVSRCPALGHDHTRRGSLAKSGCPLASQLSRLPLYLEELEADADEAEVFRRLRARLGETETPSFFLGDLDRRQGSFHSSARFTCGPTGAASFFGGSA